jgi:hypothetical protein
MIRALIRRLLRRPGAVLGPLPPALCSVCRRRIDTARRAWNRPSGPLPGEIHVAGTCSEDCSIEVLAGIRSSACLAAEALECEARRNQAAELTATRSGPLPSSVSLCPGPLCSLCNGEACMRCQPITGAQPCRHDVWERHHGLSAELGEFAIRPGQN